MTDKLSREQQMLNRTAIRAVTATEGYYKEAGFCAGFMRQVVDASGIDAPSWDAGPDAIMLSELLAQRGLEKTVPNWMPEIGDIIIWTIGHGAHGHTAMRVLANRVAENSSAHVNHGDARGFRPLAVLDKDWRWFRLWQE